VSPAPLLSIGVPVYNGERYLAAALDSALRQEYAPLEVVISDNASTDSTPDICRRYERDPRVRVGRSADTCDPITNFGRALSMARGTYFTWLAHDDVLTSPAYASTLVQMLEANRDAVLCASALELFHDEDPQARSILSYPRLATGRPWRVDRRALFRWPPGDWETLVYGIFRRDCLQRHFLENPSFQFPLQQLAFAGRFIIAPEALRGYRLHQDSLGRQRMARSPFELFLTGVSLKSRLVAAAFRGRAPFIERVPLLLEALSNFFRDPVAWAHDVRGQIRTLEAELTMLAAAADEREALVRRLGGELQPRSAAIRPPARRPRPVLSFFHRPDGDDVNDLKELTVRVADARRRCQDLLAVIEARDRELNEQRMKSVR
jgi:glycosyltransferase involved in cell wall biosynthesis